MDSPASHQDNVEPQPLHRPLSHPWTMLAIASGRTQAESPSEGHQFWEPSQGPCPSLLHSALQMLCAQVGADLSPGWRGLAWGS